MGLSVALLRAVNVGGRKIVSMEALRGLCKELGLAAPRSLLQSGNLIFETPLDEPALEVLLETQAAARLGLSTDFIIRSEAQWRGLIKANPLTEMADADPSHLVALLLKSPPPEERVEALRAAVAGREIISQAGRELYIAYPDGIGESRLTNALIERRLGLRGTARNWNTILKIASAL